MLLTAEMKKAVQSKQEPAGKLEIGTIESVFRLPNILAAFTKKYNKVDLSLFTGVTGKLEEEVLKHKLDGAFVTDSTFSPEIMSHVVFEEELVLISSKDKDFNDLKAEPVLCFSKGCGYRARLEKWFEDQKITPRKVMEFGALETILRSVVVGLGVTFVPKSAVSDLEKEGLIKTHPLPEKYSHVKTVFIRRADTFLTTTLEKFLETTKEVPVTPRNLSHFVE